ncbi:hypothetical protein [Candidatus Frankia nodulisporulans]|uniref:hypothetical protein n=1 Tax=Candidatus Frankia nodulisporulans TaxID=2060052 RepID=UPI0013D5C8FF|nr:hypothetical protein [Candidatus Frankia nodulisporulans]
MSGRTQGAPRDHADPHVTALLRLRYRLHLERPVSLSKIADRIAPDAQGRDRRNLERKIGRFFLEGTGSEGLRWPLLEAYVRLGFPPESQEEILAELATYYLRAYPQSRDCSYRTPSDNMESMRETVRRHAAEARVRMWRARNDRGAALTEQEILDHAASLLEALDRHHLFNPCRDVMTKLDATVRRMPALVAMVTMCDEELRVIDDGLEGFPPEALPVLRPYIHDHRGEHRRTLATPRTLEDKAAGAEAPTGTEAPVSVEAPAALEVSLEPAPRRKERPRLPAVAPLSPRNRPSAARAGQRPVPPADPTAVRGG